MANNKVQKRKYVIGLLVLLAMATVSTYAWTTDTFSNSDPATVYVSAESTTDATLSDYSSKPLGKNKIRIEFTATSATLTDCDMILELIDSDGNIIDATAIDNVYLDGTALANELTKNTDGTYDMDAVACASTPGEDHYILLQGDGIWTDLDGSGTNFSGVMLVIK